MTGQPEGQQDREDGPAHGEHRGQEGAGLGMGGEGTTFEPEETPEAVDDAEAVDEAEVRRREAAEASGLDGAVEPRELVPDDDRVDELEAPREVLPDEERGVDDLTETESESERLLPDPDRPVPGGPADPL